MSQALGLLAFSGGSADRCEKISPLERWTGTYQKSLQQSRNEAFPVPCPKACGTWIMDNPNVPIGASQPVLGQENRTTTEIYLHSSSDTEHEAISVYERAIQKSHPESYPEMARA